MLTRPLLYCQPYSLAFALHARATARTCVACVPRLYKIALLCFRAAPSLPCSRAARPDVYCSGEIRGTRAAIARGVLLLCRGCAAWGGGRAAALAALAALGGVRCWQPIAMRGAILLLHCRLCCCVLRGAARRARARACLASCLMRRLRASAQGPPVLAIQPRAIQPRGCIASHVRAGTQNVACTSAVHQAGWPDAGIEEVGCGWLARDESWLCAGRVQTRRAAATLPKRVRALFCVCTAACAPAAACARGSGADCALVCVCSARCMSAHARSHTHACAVWLVVRLGRGVGWVGRRAGRAGAGRARTSCLCIPAASLSWPAGCITSGAAARWSAGAAHS